MVNKKAGQPPRYGKRMKRTQVFLTEEQRQFAIDKGKAISTGVQMIIDEAMKKGKNEGNANRCTFSAGLVNWM